MKITKDEKWLYKTLNIVNSIFGKTEGRTIIAGNGNELFFASPDYCGVFVSKESGTALINEYDFDRCLYELKQLPNKEYVLDRYDYGGALEIARDISSLESFVNARLISKEWRMEMMKDYPHKAAKIAADTGKWLRDEDVALLKHFPVFDVMTVDYGLAVHYYDDFCEIWFVFMNSIVEPNNEDSTQVKIDAYMEQDNEGPEEFEDEFDPMG